MKWNELQSVWSQQQPLTAEKTELENLQRSFGRKSRRLASNLLWRDLIESAAGLIVAGLFAHAGWRGGRAYWPFGVAVLLILGLTAFFIFERIRVRRRRLRAEAPLLAKLEADLAELRHQHRLLQNIALWYLAPCMTAWAIVLATVCFNKTPTGWHQQLFLGGYIIFCALLTWGIWLLNRRAARKSIAPRIGELEKMRDAILSPQPYAENPEVGPSQLPEDEVLLAKLQADRREFETLIGKRDRRELITALATALFLGLCGMIAHRRGAATTWPFAVGCGCALALALFLTGTKTLASWRRDRHEASLRGELAKAREQTSHQIWLLRNVAWWYVLPTQAARWLFGLGLVLNAGGKAPAALLLMLALWTVLLGRGAINLYHLNQDAVRDQLLPRRELLDKLMAQWLRKGAARNPNPPIGS